MKSVGSVFSGTPPLSPSAVYDVTTGEQLTRDAYESSMGSLIRFVVADTRRLHDECGVRIAQDIHNAQRIGSANSFGRMRGYASSYKTLPREILAKSRINELILHKWVGETASHVLNPNPRKQPLSFGPNIHLGAVNAQMASLSLDDEGVLSLHWKCWDRELLIQFRLHEYYASMKNITWSLPTVRIEEAGVRFYFAYKTTPVPKPNKGVRAGLDLGRVKPYSMVFEDRNGTIVSHDASARLVHLERLRNANLEQKTRIKAKLDAYQALGVETPKKARLVTERSRKAGKARVLGNELAAQMGAEVAQLMERHEAHMLVMEDLTWVQGRRYGGRWNHSVQQQRITHALNKRGMKTKTTNPAGTSRHCHACKTPITFNSKTRTVRCAECQTVLDRDYNAALNIMKQQHYLVKRTMHHNVVSDTHGSIGVVPRRNASTIATPQAPDSTG